MVARLRQALPRGIEIKTGDRAAADDAKQANDSIGGFLRPALLAFSGAALLVGAFIIFNTFSISVAQRRREFALLRSIGATRRQVLLAVASEALVLGVAASVLGLVCGLGFAKGLGALFDAGKGPGVWLVSGEPARVNWRPVVVERLDDDGARVTGSLQQGDRIVALGAHLLREGEQVRVADQAGAVAARGDRP